MNFSSFIDKAVQVFNASMEWLQAMVSGKVQAKSKQTDNLSNQTSTTSVATQGNVGESFPQNEGKQGVFSQSNQPQQQRVTVQMTHEQYQYFLYRWQEVCKYRQQANQGSNLSNTSLDSSCAVGNESFDLQEQKGNGKQSVETQAGYASPVQKESVASNEGPQQSALSVQQTQKDGQSDDSQKEKKQSSKQSYEIKQPVSHKSEHTVVRPSSFALEPNQYPTGQTNVDNG